MTRLANSECINIIVKIFSKSICRYHIIRSDSSINYNTIIVEIHDPLVATFSLFREYSAIILSELCIKMYDALGEF